MSNDIRNELAHHGILGMKWGVRRYQNQDGSLTSAGKKHVGQMTEKQVAKADKKWEKAAVSKKEYFKVYNSFATRMNTGEIKKFNSDPRWKNLDLKNDKNAAKKYFDAYAKKATEILNQESSKIIGSNASGTKTVSWTYQTNSALPSFSIVDTKVQHSDETETLMDVEFDSKGFIISVDIPEDSLTHYGILGQKWGVRRSPEELGHKPSAVRREEKKLGKMAVKDAQTYAKAKMAYGQGAGIQRRHVKADVEAKMRNPAYKKSFEDAMNTINYAKATNKAEKWRKGEDRKIQTKRSVKATAKFLTGTSSLAAAGILYAQHKEKVDGVVRNAFDKVKMADVPAMLSKLKNVVKP